MINRRLFINLQLMVWIRSNEAEHVQRQGNLRAAIMRILHARPEFGNHTRREWMFCVSDDSEGNGKIRRKLNCAYYTSLRSAITHGVTRACPLTGARNACTPCACVIYFFSLPSRFSCVHARCSLTWPWRSVSKSESLHPLLRITNHSPRSAWTIASSNVTRRSPK